MAKQGAVRLSGRFSPGTEVRLVKVGGPHVLRSEGGEDVDSQTVADDGTLEFTKGVEPGARYFAVGLIDGHPVEVRLTGRTRDDVNSEVFQAPVQPDRTRRADGSWSDERPTRESPPKFETAPIGQRQVPEGTVQRIDTGIGQAYPLDPEEKAPYRSQEDVPDGTVQMVSSPEREDEVTGRKVSGGRATEIVQSIQRQDEVPPGVVQRIDTGYGQAYPIPAGDAVQAALIRDSAAGKESRGEPGRAAAEPLDGEQKLRTRKSREQGVQSAPGAQNPRDVTSGHDAMGQPVYADVAAGLGIEPAKKPTAALRGDKPVAERPDAERSEGQVPPALTDPPQDAGASETETASTGAGSPKPSGEIEVTKARATRSSKRSSRSSKKS